MKQIFTIPALLTNRLLLRPLEPSDHEQIQSLRSDESVNQFLDRPKTITCEEARAFINKIDEGFKKNEWLYWAITFNNDKLLNRPAKESKETKVTLPNAESNIATVNKLIGTICLWNISTDRRTAEIGFELLPEFQCKGIMSESIARIIDFGFHYANLKTIEAYTHPNNFASIKLLEKYSFKRDFNNENRRNINITKAVIYSLHIE